MIGTTEVGHVLCSDHACNQDRRSQALLANRQSPGNSRQIDNAVRRCWLYDLQLGRQDYGRAGQAAEVLGSLDRPGLILGDAACGSGPDICALLDLNLSFIIKGFAPRPPVNSRQSNREETTR